MMAYEKAIRLLAHLECPQPPGMSDVKYLSLVDDVCRSKFTYVVASQVCRLLPARWLLRGCSGWPLRRLQMMRCTA